MSRYPSIHAATYVRAEEIIRIGRRAVREAQADSRRRGVPNVYALNGLLYYELPCGTLSLTDPYRADQDSR